MAISPFKHAVQQPIPQIIVEEAAQLYLGGRCKRDGIACAWPGTVEDAHDGVGEELGGEGADPGRMPTRTCEFGAGVVFRRPE